MLPTKAEIEAHFPLHLEYRSWCKHCVHGKGRSNRHLAKDEDEESLGVTWHGDYAFTSGVGYDETEEGMQASLVMYDDSKDSFWAVGVDEKGATESMIKYGVGIIEQSGYNGGENTFKTERLVCKLDLNTQSEFVFS